MKRLLIISLLFFVNMLNADDRAVRISTKIMQKENRVALVIGNNNYQGVLSKLRNPINDASAIRDILKSKNFKVIYKTNSGKRDMRKALKEFYREIKKGGVGFFYFSGHGIEIDGQNYLIPIDAKIDEKTDAEYEAISLNKVTKRIQNAKNRLNIVVLDACRNDPFSRSVGTGGLAKSEPIGLFVSYSTGAGSVASDGKDGENGLFTKSLIKYMQQPLDLQDVFQKTREDVYDSSNQRQFPAIYNQTIRGKFYFTLPTESSIAQISSTKKSSSKNIVTENTQPKNDSSLTFGEEMDDDFENFMNDMK